MTRPQPTQTATFSAALRFSEGLTSSVEALTERLTLPLHCLIVSGQPQRRVWKHHIGERKSENVQRKAIFTFCRNLFCVQIALSHTVPKTNVLMKTTERWRAEKHLPQSGCWLTDSPQENNGHHHASSGSVKTYGHPLLPQKPTNLCTDAAIEKKLNANQFCVLACLGVCFPQFSTSVSGRGQMSQRGFVYL